MQLSTQFDFEVINNIKSEGVNSSLYMVKDLQVGSKFILKQIDKKGLKEPERYFEESKKIYKLKHPNIMEIHSASYDNEYIYNDALLKKWITSASNRKSKPYTKTNNKIFIRFSFSDILCS